MHGLVDEWRTPWGSWPVPRRVAWVLQYEAFTCVRTLQLRADDLPLATDHQSAFPPPAVRGEACVANPVGHVG